MKKVLSNFVALTVVLFCLSLFVGINIYAADTRPCADDISKFCKDVKHGGGRIANCLQEHEMELSPGVITCLQDKD